MSITEVFDGIIAEELLVTVLSYATPLEAVRLCHEWSVSAAMKALAWPDTINSIQYISSDRGLA